MVLKKGCMLIRQLFNTSEQLFPPSKCANSFTCKNVTLPPGEHVFAFSIKVGSFMIDFRFMGAP